MRVYALSFYGHHSHIYRLDDTFIQVLFVDAVPAPATAKIGL